MQTEDYISKQYIHEGGSGTKNFERPCVRIILQGEPNTLFAINSKNINDSCFLERTGYFDLNLLGTSSAFISYIHFFEDSKEVIVDYFERA